MNFNIKTLCNTVITRLKSCFTLIKIGIYSKFIITRIYFKRLYKRWLIRNKLKKGIKFFKTLYEDAVYYRYMGIYEHSTYY